MRLLEDSSIFLIKVNNFNSSKFEVVTVSNHKTLKVWWDVYKKKILFHPQSHKSHHTLNIFMIKECSNLELWWIKIIVIY